MKKFLLSLLAVAFSFGLSAQTNLLENGDFETWADGVPTNWGSAASVASNATISQETENVHGGSYAVKLASATSNKRIAYKPITLKAGTYTLSFYGYGDLVKQGYAIITDGKIADSKNDYKYSSDSNTELTANEWTQVTAEFTLEASTTVSIIIMRQKKSTDDGLIIDDVTLTTTDGGIDESGTSGGDNTGTETDIANTPETAYTVAKAYELIAAGEGLDTYVYVKGYVTSIKEISTTYGNATYYISDTKGDETTVLTVYRGKYLENASFTDDNKDNLAAGDEVVIYGKLVDYNGTYEISSGNYLYSINGKTSENTGTDISNTAETAYTVAKAHELIAAGEGLDTSVYVKGYVTSVSSFNSSHGSITYYLGDTTDDANPLQIYGGLYYNGDMFTSKDDLQVGDEIVVYGQLTTYNGTDEMAKNNVVITHKRDGKTVTPSGTTVDISNTPETAYTVAKAIELINAGEGLTTKVYVKGYIVGTPSISTSYGNATYKISDTKGDETTTITVYRGYYLDNEKFTSEDQLATGDEVVVYGTLTYYNNTTYEVNSGNYLYSLNGQTSGISTVEQAEADNAPVYNIAGQRVSGSAKGLLIKNGKKFIVK